MNKKDFIEKFKEYDDTSRKVYMNISDARGYEIGELEEEFYKVSSSDQLVDFLDRLYDKFKCDSADFNERTKEGFSYHRNDKWVDGETNESLEHFYHSFDYCLYQGCNGKISFYIRFVNIDRIDEFLSKYKEPYKSMAYKMVEDYHGRMSDVDLINYMYYNEDFYGENNSIYDVLYRNWHRKWDSDKPSSPESVAHYELLLPKSMEYTKELIIKELTDIGYIMDDIDVIINDNELIVSNKYLQFSEGLRACSTIKTWTEHI